MSSTNTFFDARIPIVAFLVALLLLPASSGQVGIGGSIEADGDGVDASVSAEAGDDNSTDADGGSGVEADADAEAAFDADLIAEIEASLASASAMANASAVRIGAHLEAAAEARLWQRAEQDGRYGQFEEREDERSGSYVAMRIETSAIRSYEVRASAGGGSAMFFESIDIGGDVSARMTDGPRAHAWTSQAHIQATDGPSGALRVTASSDMRIDLELASGVEAQQEGEDLLWLEAAGRSGALAVVGEGTISLQGSSVQIDLGPGSIVRFEAESGSDWRDEQRSFSSGRLGAELSIIADADAHIALADEYTVAVTDVEAEPGDVAFTVDSEVHAARAIVVDLDAALFAAAEDVEMRFDGQLAQKAPDGASVHADADASVPLYSIVEADGALQAVVHVPGFSAHRIAFMSASPQSGDGEAAGEDAPGAGVLVAGIALAAVAIARRRF